MQVLQKWLQMVYDDHVSNDYDLIVPVIGDEGKGKSTLIMELVWLWLNIIDEEQTVDNAMSAIAWDLPEFKTMLGSLPQYSVIVVHDAARVMSRKKAMHGSQIEVEEDLLDARFGNYLILLGYQDFDIVPTVLAERRAKQLLRVVKRGWVHGHKEQNIRKRHNTGNWPEPSMRDSYPDLEGTKLWNAFTTEDQRRKQERIKPDEEESNEERSIDEIFELVREDGIENVISIHGGHNKPYFDADLVEYEYDISSRKAKKVTKLLKREFDLSDAAT